MLQQEPRRTPPAFLAGLLVVGVLVGFLYLFMRGERSGPVPGRHLPMGEAEQAYSTQIQFVDPQMSRAANLLNQEVTYVNGNIINSGTRVIRQVEVTLEFRDVLNQVVLRDTRFLLGPRPAPVGPGQRREFQIAFDFIPVDWNRQYPSIRVTGLRLE